MIDTRLKTLALGLFGVLLLLAALAPNGGHDLWQGYVAGRLTQLGEARLAYPDKTTLQVTPEFVAEAHRIGISDDLTGWPFFSSQVSLPLYAALAMLPWPVAELLVRLALAAAAFWSCREITRRQPDALWALGCFLPLLMQTVRDGQVAVLFLPFALLAQRKDLTAPAGVLLAVLAAIKDWPVALIGVAVLLGHRFGRVALGAFVLLLVVAMFTVSGPWAMPSTSWGLAWPANLSLFPQFGWFALSVPIVLLCVAVLFGEDVVGWFTAPRGFERWWLLILLCLPLFWVTYLAPLPALLPKKPGTWALVGLGSTVFYATSVVPITVAFFVSGLLFGVVASSLGVALIFEKETS